MTDISSIASKQSAMRSSTAILKSILNKDRTPEPGMIPLLTGAGFKTDDGFVANIARLVMEMRAEKSNYVAKAVSSESQAAQAKVIKINSADAGKVFGDSGNDTITINANRVDYVSARAGDDKITITANGKKDKVEGLSALDSGSVTRIYGGDGKDTIDITAEELVTEVQGGNGNDTVTVKAAFVSRITSGEGNDTVSVTANSIDRVEGNAGDDLIDLTATVDKSLDEKLKNSTDSGSVRNVLGGVGKDTIKINADIFATDINAGSGDDTVTIHADTITSIDAGSGNDRVDLTGNHIEGINTNSGDDDLTIQSSMVANIWTGYGNDKINIHGGQIIGVDGGAGDDEITLSHLTSKTKLEKMLLSDPSFTGNMPVSTMDSAGNEIIGPDPYAQASQPSYYMDIHGGAGKDKITIENQFGSVADVDGGAGDDTITVTASDISGISGGKGNDTLNLQSTQAKGTVSVYFAEGDGNDTINTTSSIEIRRYSADGTKELGLKGATLTKVENATDTYRLTFSGSKDSITLHFYEPGIRPNIVTPVIDGNTISWVPKAA